MSSPLPFTPPSLHDAAAVRHAAGDARQSDLAFANIYLLRQKYGTEIALDEGVLYRHFGGHGRLQGYAFPCGAVDSGVALRRLEEDAVTRKRPFRFCLLTEEQVRQLELLYPGRFRFQADRGDADYLYERSALAELPGARFHRKRNHIARFCREFPDWHLEALSADNVQDALEVASGWLAGAQQQAADSAGISPALLHEHGAIAHALQVLEPLGLFGAVLYVAGAPVAMTLASMLSASVADVHYEKCLPAVRQAYPVINQAFAAGLSCAFINREEDLNQEGLRQAKLSYFPSLILSKWTAVPC